MASPKKPARVRVTLQGRHGPLTADYYPATQKRGAAARRLLVLAHGFPGATRLDKLVRALRAKGFSVLCPYFAGVGPSPGAFSFQRAQEDFAFLVETLHRYPLFRGKEVGLVGYSMGTAYATRAALLNPRVKVLVLLSGKASFKRLAEEEKRALQRAVHQAVSRHHLTADQKTLFEEWLAFGRRNSLIDLIARVRPALPVLVLHGTRDTVVPARDARAVFEARAAVAARHKKRPLAGLALMRTGHEWGEERGQEDRLARAGREIGKWAKRNWKRAR